jgi:hypothetical protein
MKFTFAQDWHDFKVGDRVPASVNKSYLLRHGIVKRYSHVEALEAQQVEAVEEALEPILEAPASDETPKPKAKGKKK